MAGRRERGSRAGRWWIACALALCALALAGAAEAQAATLSGTVTYGRDDVITPQLGATVTVSDPRGGPVATATTDAIGGYAVAVPDGFYDVTVSSPGLQDEQFQLDLSVPRQLDVTMVMPRWKRFVSTLSDGAGPVAGATVQLGWRTTTTARDGSFALFAPAAIHDVALSGSGWAFRGELDLVADVTVPLVLPHRGDLTVRATDFPSGDRLQNAAVELPSLQGTVDLAPSAGLAGVLSTPARSATTDAAGEARFAVFAGTGAPEGGTVVPDSPRYRPWRFSTQTVAPGQLIDLTLTWHALITGTLTDPDGPLGGYSIGTREELTPTQPDGSFAFFAPSWREQFHVEYEDATGWWRLIVPADLSRDRTLDVRLPVRTTSTVRVVDGDGRPVEGARVEAPWLNGTVSVGGADSSLTQYASGVTDGDGEIAFRLFAGSGPTTGWSAQPPSGSALPTVEFDLDGAVTTVVLADPPPPDVTLSGTLRGPDGAAAGAVMQLGRATTTTDEDGAFSFTVAPGIYDLTGSWTAEDGAQATVSAPDLELTANRSLLLRWTDRAPRVVAVRDPEGRPVEGARVSVPAYSITGGTTPGSTLTLRLPEVVTGPSGDAQLRVLGGAAQPASGESGVVEAPSGSLLDDATFVPWASGSTAPIVVTLRSSAVAPAIDLQVVPDPLVPGDWWSLSRVAVQVTATDAAGVRALACSVDGVTRTFAQTTTATARAGTFHVNLEGRHVAACTAVDGDGVTGSAERPVNLDLKNPLAPTATADRPADSANGWHRDTVTVAFADNGDPLLADGTAGSGVDPASVPAPQTFDSSGTHVASGTVSDRSGRTSAAGKLTVKVDATPPTSSLTCPAAPVTRGASATARWADADAHSGLGGTSGGTVALDTSAVGTFTAHHDASDRVGHRAFSSCGYAVVHPFTWRGNLQAPPSLNAVAPGVTALTVWFSIGGDRGLGILARDGVAVQPVACGDGSPAGPAVPATLTGPLGWDAGTGRYSLGWSVASDLPSGACAALRITLDDGVERTALFAR